MLSPRDWRLATEWHDRGVPLGLVLEILESRAGRPPRGLAGIAAAVEDAWSAVEAGRASPARGDGVPRRASATPLGASEAWEDARARAPAGSALRDLLERLVQESHSGLSDDELDARLDDALAASVPAEFRDGAEREARERLAPHRRRMPPEAYASTLHRAVVDRLRQRLGLPRRRSC